MDTYFAIFLFIVMVIIIYLDCKEEGKFNQEEKDEYHNQV